MSNSWIHLIELPKTYRSSEAEAARMRATFEELLRHAEIVKPRDRLNIPGLRPLGELVLYWDLTPSPSALKHRLIATIEGWMEDLIPPPTQMLATTTRKTSGASFVVLTENEEEKKVQVYKEVWPAGMQETPSGGMRVSFGVTDVTDSLTLALAERYLNALHLL